MGLKPPHTVLIKKSLEQKIEYNVHISEIGVGWGGGL